MEKSPPKEAPADISPEELVTLKQWWEDELKTRCYVMASMSNEMQRRFEKTKYAADILFHLKELYGENSRHERFTAVKELMKPLPISALRSWLRLNNGGRTSLRLDAM
ncbi:guanosine nucleotide diphosphate dissociation inhibitor 2-like [Dorcoceras hygrometricum]|uniref:Guanosine nucleotide diphosphate dissociation inhibitor 2-like n=1 Tax=Dorcoceras hygrometricum TaxID=472368 RepID=A0A2Z7CWS6_9LAMI|nr:guanosine nucleotide diphosphate dissociation inhibitor 2-like [Dorcoceras hygrometricum]